MPRLHVLCSFTADQIRAMAPSVPAFRHMATAGWDYRELPGWHWPMFDRPAGLAAILAGVSPGSGVDRR